MQNRNSASAACVFFLFLLLTPVSPQCRMATADECRRSPDFIPGHNLAHQGFDITRLVHSPKNVFSFQEWKHPNGSCTLCENHLLKGKPLLRLPLGITDWKASIICQQEVQHSVASTCISLANVMTELIVKKDWKTDLDVMVDPSTYTQIALEGSHSKWISHCRYLSSLDKYIFLHHHVSCSYYKFRASGNRSISDEFKKNINSLPQKLDSFSKWHYKELILRFGTHFMTELDFGARVNYVTFVKVCKLPLENYTISEVSRCLEIEVGALTRFNEVSKDPDFQTCKQEGKNLNFRLLVSEYIKNLEGGRTSYIDLTDKAFNFPEFSKQWLESAKSLPALLSSTLEPIHTLLDKNDTRRKNLQQVVSEYVRTQALLRNCTVPCPPGVQQSAWDPCSCECPDNDLTNSMCCSQQFSLGKLTITIQHAKSLWGDFFSESDGYISVSNQNKKMCTRTVWNNNNPKWNISMDFGIVKLIGDFAKVEIEVWDEDFGWNDDLLGRCFLTLKPWEIFEHKCKLNYGTLYYKGQLACGFHLGGPSCGHYVPLWPKADKNSKHTGKAVK